MFTTLYWFSHCGRLLIPDWNASSATLGGRRSVRIAYELAIFTPVTATRQTPLQSVNQSRSRIQPHSRRSTYDYSRRRTSSRSRSPHLLQPDFWITINFQLRIRFVRCQDREDSRQRPCQSNSPARFRDMHAAARQGHAMAGAGVYERRLLHRNPPRLVLMNHKVYCLSYTSVLVNFLPWASVPLEVTVRLLPSSDTTILPVVVIFVPFFTVKSNS